TVSSPGESSIRYMPDLMSAGFRAKVVLRSAISRNFRARVRCTFVHAELTDLDTATVVFGGGGVIQRQRLTHDRRATVVLLSAACLAGRKVVGMSYQK